MSDAIVVIVALVIFGVVAVVAFKFVIRVWTDDRWP